MAVQEKPPKLTAKKLPQVDMTLADFTGGFNSFLDEARTPLNAARDATNMMQKQDGLWATRWGTQNYGAAYTSCDGIGTATKYTAGLTSPYTQFLLMVDNGVLKRSTDGGSWTTIALGTGATNFTAGYHCDMLQIASRVYIANGKDKLAYYDISADTLMSFTGLPTPAAPTLAVTGSTLTSGGSNPIFYRISAVNAVGETAAGAESSSFAVSKPRDSWITNTSGSDFVTISWSAVSGAIRYNIYYSDASGYETYLDSTSGTTYRDDGSAAANNFIAAPAGDTTTGPIFSRMGLSDNRMWATGDPSNPWRVYWSGTGQYQGAFSPFFGGGYIDLDKGGEERPIQIKHYRDGKGDAQTTVLTTNNRGEGSEWQISLSTETIGDVTILIPSASKVVGSVGSNSPDGIIEARNNIYFPSSRGFFSIGSKPSLLNVLSTDEISLNIRPDVKNISNAYTSKIAGTYFDGKLFWAVPKGSTTNNEIWILDLEHNSWARPWAVGIKQFVIYTSSDGQVHMLGVPVNGTKLLEFSESFLGDNGAAFNTSYRTGLIHFDKNHRQFATVKYAYIELGRPQGNITFNVLGTQKNKSFATLGSITISNISQGSGFSSELFSDMLFSEPADAPVTFSQSSVKKRIKVNKKVNNIQLEVTSGSATSNFAINQFMVKGHLVSTADPSSWKQ